MLKTARDMLNKFWYGPGHAIRTEFKKDIEEILSKRFPSAKIITVKDVSGGNGAIYEVTVEAIDFKNLSLLKQHQQITDALKDKIKLIHGIRIVTKTPVCDASSRKSLKESS